MGKTNKIWVFNKKHTIRKGETRDQRMLIVAPFEDHDSAVEELDSKYDVGVLNKCKTRGYKCVCRNTDNIYGELDGMTVEEALDYAKEQGADEAVLQDLEAGLVKRKGRGKSKDKDDGNITISFEVLRVIGQAAKKAIEDGKTVNGVKITPSGGFDLDLEEVEEEDTEEADEEPEEPEVVADEDDDVEEDIEEEEEEEEEE